MLPIDYSLGNILPYIVCVCVCVLLVVCCIVII